MSRLRIVFVYLKCMLSLVLLRSYGNAVLLLLGLPVVGPSLGLPFRQYIYLSFYHVAFGKITQKSLRIALMSSSELLVVFCFVETEKSFKQFLQIF